MDYKLTFLPKNPLPAGAIISLHFPATFPIVTGANANNYIISGLSDISETSTVGMDISGNILDITNFRPQSIPALITLQLRLTNPINPGQTTPIEITTYQNSSKLSIIDQDIVVAITNIANIPSGTLHYLGTTNYATNLLIPSIDFHINPSKVIPANGYIKIQVPNGFIVNGESRIFSQIILNIPSEHMSSE